MFVERRTNASNGTVELWWCKWDMEHKPAKKIQIKRLSVEAPKLTAQAESELKPAICWTYGRTVGNVAVFSPELLGSFPKSEGDDALLACEFVHAGKFRHGVERWWCRTHQAYWGTKADIESNDRTGQMCCSEHSQPMSYVVAPLTLNLSEYEEVGIWCSMPAALSTGSNIPKRAPRIHVHVREKAGNKKIIDKDFRAISVLYSDKEGLFGNQEITRVNITPPAAFEFVTALERGQALGCVNCGRCGYPHLDLGDFARVEHKKHYCGNCGYDSTHSKGKIISTPLQPLHDQFAGNLKYETPDRTLNLDDYSDCQFVVWASTPAIVWTAIRPQELGIHVHVVRNSTRIIDETFGKVIYKGETLLREDLVHVMADRSVI